MEIFHTNFGRTLTSADVKRNIPFPFAVPPGVTQLHIRLTFSPAMVDEIRNMLTLSLFDPAGFRGAGHRHGTQHDVVISRAQATHGYCAGEIAPGEWQVVVDTHMIMPDAPCVIRLEVNGSDAPVGGTTAPVHAGHTRARGRGWYRGDLHAHTLHSDATWDVPELVAWAREQKLDFVTLSDHNTVAGLAQMDAARADDLLTMGGMEFTTFWGHALALGVREWIDWRTNPAVGDARTMPQIAAEVGAKGGLFIIAHPMAVGDPYCTGCQWVYTDMRPGPARVVEVWNSDARGESRNGMCLKLAYDWLNEGYKLALTSGTDNHGRHPEQMHYGFNHVYAEELSETEILRAIRAGHSYVSAGPALGFSATFGEQQVMMGDVLDARHGMPVQFSARWKDSPANAELALIANGEPQFALSASGEGSHSWEMPAGEAHWCLLTLRAASGEILALTNPIFLDGRS